MSISSNMNLIDLLSDADFRQWVKTGDYKIAGNYWSKWRRENPDKEEIVKQAIQILLASHVDDEITESEVDEIVDGTWERIQFEENKVKPLRRQWWWVAASVGVIIAGFWVSRNLQFEKNTDTKIAVVADSEKWMTRINRDKKPMLIMLSDSSSVVLLPGSVLRYPSKFNIAIREVQLTGEAFFEISKHPDQPFLVHTQTITTRVVGTSFNVRAYDNEADVNVTVKTGKVTVYAKTGDLNTVPKNAVVLLPDQHVVFNKTENKMYQPTSKTEPVQLVLGTASFEFVDTPVTAILDSIASVYGLKMDYNKAGLAKCILTTSLTDTPLQGKLKIICKALGQNASYEVTDSRIIFYGNGCD